jgi:hypothetical protein
MPNPTSRTSRTNRRSLALLLPAIVLTLAACAGAGAPSPSPLPSAAPAGTTRPSPTPVPGDPGNGGGIGIDPGTGTGTDPGAGGGTGGDPGTGIGIPLPGGGQDPNLDPLFGQANYVTPTPGLLNLRPVNVQLVRAVQNADGTITVDLRWWSGVAPCNQLDHVEIAKDEVAQTIRFTVIEGTGAGDVACIEIAQLNATTVELGTLTAGEWQLSAATDAPTITLQVK